MNFKFICLLLTFAGVFALISNANAEYETFSSAIKTKYLTYIDCVLDRKSCDFIGEKIKEFLSDWFKNECADCDLHVKSQAKTIISNVQKNFPEDWQLIEQKYDGKSSVQKVHPKFPAPSKPSVQGPQINSESEKLVSIEDIFVNDQFFGAKAVICLIKRKGCDERMKFFRKSIFLFATVNTCPGCQKPTVLKWFTDLKNFLEQSFPEVLQDIIANKGE